MDEYKNIIQILKKEVVPALGCTEPVAVALAASNAAKAAGDGVKHIKVIVSSGIYKNGMAVGIPGIDRVGIDIAAALGAVGGDPAKGLEVLENIDGKAASRAMELVDSEAVEVEVLDRSGVYIDCRVAADAGNGRCIIEESHTNIVLVESNGKSIGLSAGEKTGEKAKDDPRTWLQGKRISDIINLVREIPDEDIAFMLNGRDMNLAVARKGLQERIGMGVGYNLYSMIKKGMVSDDTGYYVSALTAAGADVRMAGVKMPVMSSAGSGNHGLTAILPVVAVAEKYGKNDGDLARGLALSHLVTIYIKNYTGKLSALCGCAVAAAIGASTGIALLMGATNRQIEGTIKNMIANVTGMICDGGKAGCALKLSTAASAAFQSALLAMDGVVVPCDNGIIHCSVEKTIQNLGKVSYPGMTETDKAILEVMVENSHTNKRDCAGC
ncbi:MAG: putative inner membrane protein [Firmicutes bacterium]|nr:putative inner membrane protein [Bacillota bacterium]